MISLEEYKAAGRAKGFYDMPLYFKGGEKPSYYKLFKWKKSNMITPGSLGGYLKTELFDSLEKKIAYIQGVFEDSGFSEDTLSFANSQKKVERCIEWINEIAWYINGTFGQGVISRETLYLCPICHTLKINLKVAQFIRNYKLGSPLPPKVKVFQDITYSVPEK